MVGLYAEGLGLLLGGQREGVRAEDKGRREVCDGNRATVLVQAEQPPDVIHHRVFSLDAVGVRGLQVRHGNCDLRVERNIAFHVVVEVVLDGLDVEEEVLGIGAELAGEDAVFRIAVLDRAEFM